MWPITTNVLYFAKAQLGKRYQGRLLLTLLTFF